MLEEEIKIKEDILRKSKYVIIIGTGLESQNLYRFIRDLEKEVLYFVDDSLKNKTLFGRKIISHEDLKNTIEKEPNIPIIFANRDLSINYDIYKTLIDNGVNKNLLFSSIILGYYPNIPYYIPAFQDYKNFLSLFEENEFKKDIDIIMDFNFNLNKKTYLDLFIFTAAFYSEYCSIDPKNIYFYEDKVNLKDGDIAIDGGANSDSFEFQHSTTFAKLVKEKGFVYAFEPVERVYKALLQDIERSGLTNIKALKKGLWWTEDTAHFSDDGVGGIVKNDLSKVELTSLDNFVEEEKLNRVDFIKMDIEGAELEALEGAIQTIKTFKPKLAICIYHKPEHFSSIPLFIKKLVPNYKIYLINNEPWLYMGTKIFATT